MRSRVLAILLVTAFLLSAHSVNAQRLTAGIKVGGQITDALSASAPANPSFDHFTFGPVVEASITHQFSLEFDALHAHYAYNYFIIGPLHGAIGMDDTHIRYWNFPLLLKWQPAPRRLAPFFDAGIANRYATGTGLAPTLYPIPLGAVPVAPPQSISLHKWTIGPAVAGGVSYSVGSFHFSPELRYTYWTKPAIAQSTINAATAWEAKRNQFEVLLGVTMGR